MLRSLEQSKQDLAHVAPLLEGAIRSALKRFVTEHKTSRHVYSRRSEASIIHDLMVAEARLALEGLPGVACQVTKGSFVVIVNQVYVIKLKKMDAGLRTSNIPTQTSLAFVNQKPMQLTLPHVPSETHVVFGYQLPGPELMNALVWATCPMGAGLKWSWLIETTPLADIVPFTSPYVEAQDAPLYALKQDDGVASGKKQDGSDDK
jgi:hypothetical protein